MAMMGRRGAACLPLLCVVTLLLSPVVARLFGTGVTRSPGRQQPQEASTHWTGRRMVLQSTRGEEYDYYEEAVDEPKAAEQEWAVDWEGTVDDSTEVQNDVAETGNYEGDGIPEEVQPGAVQEDGDWEDEQLEGGEEDEVYAGPQEVEEWQDEAQEEEEVDGDVENEQQQEEEKQEWAAEYEEAQHDLEEFQDDPPIPPGGASPVQEVEAEVPQEEEEDIARPSAVLDLTDGAGSVQEAEETWEKAVEDDADWVLTLANALRNGDEVAMERAVNLAVGSGEASAVEEVVMEAREMENGSTLSSIWERVQEKISESPADDTALEAELEAAEKMEVEAEAMGEEAEEYMGEAEILKHGAEDLEAQAGSIDGEAEEYDRLEVTDELGEAAEALDGEAAKLELEAAKLKAEAAKLEQQADTIESKVIGDGEGGEANWLDNEAAYLKDEASKLTTQAENLKLKANNLDEQADRIDRIEAEKLERVERERQARIDQDLDRGDETLDEAEDLDEYNFDTQGTSRHSIKTPLSHSALVDRFKNLLHA